jgi:hypothetical protein
MSLSRVTIDADRYDDLCDCWAFSEDLDTVMLRLYASKGSFQDALAAIGADMDMRVFRYEETGKPWDSPTEHLSDAVDMYLTVTEGAAP